MPIACTRCGAKEDGEIITAPIAFAFKHALGCGHGVGPLAVVKGQVTKKKEEIPHTDSVKQVKEIVAESKQTIDDSKKEKKSFKEKIKVFGSDESEKTKAESQKD